MRTEPKPIYKMRVVYKSGYTHDFEVYSFTFTGTGYKWEPACADNRPIDMGATEVAAIWQVGVRFE